MWLLAAVAWLCVETFSPSTKRTDLQYLILVHYVIVHTISFGLNLSHGNIICNYKKTHKIVCIRQTILN